MSQFEDSWNKNFFEREQFCHSINQIDFEIFFTFFKTQHHGKFINTV